MEQTKSTYGVGDRLIIREDLKVSERYGHYSGSTMDVTEEMANLSGLECLITGFRYEYYQIDLDCGRWKWSDGMFDGLVECAEFDLPSVECLWKEY